jgi:hypothetical protein
MEDRLVAELTSLKGKQLSVCAVYLTSLELSWVSYPKQHRIPAAYLVGAEIVPTQETDFTVHAYNPRKHKFTTHRFRCISYDDSSMWVMAIERLAYPHYPQVPRNFAVLLNPISGKKEGRKLYYKQLLPMLQVTPTSHALFGKA